ncbi:MAG: hypothetical protein K0U24_08540 [Gammaproteobacteria bacterium]|nr:hypothetical protein [Gammaproteobacteria bacterium]MCH9764249.1 hypothetical protein [Gammaproteobacteria bacterium]
MSGRTQHTHALMCEHMNNRYGEFDQHTHQKNHKHDKRHFTYEPNCKSHPSKKMRNQEQLEAIKSHPDLLNAFAKEKRLKRLARTPFH